MSSPNSVVLTLLSDPIILILLILGILSSLFRGWVAVKAFMYPKKEDTIPSYHIEWYLHQRWIHFIGSMLGWLALICTYIYLISGLKIGIEIVFLFFFSSMGIMGFLPLILWNISWSTNELVKILKR